MKKDATFRPAALVAGVCALAAIIGCGGGGGDGGTPAASAPLITTASLPAGVRGQPYSAVLQAAGGTSPYVWSEAGLPPGISLAPATGALTGTPTDNGVFTLTLTVTDSLGRQAAISLGVRIAVPLALYVADSRTPSGSVNIFDNASAAAGGSAWTRRLKGALTGLDNALGGPPAGVSYDPGRNILYVARARGSDNGAVVVFHDADVADGNIAPSRTIATFTIAPKTYALTSPSDVFIDSANDRIYIADVTGSSGFILLMDGAGTAPTFRKIIGFPGGPPAAISVDTARDVLYVVPSLGAEIVAYDNVSAPSGAPRTIAIGGVAGVGLSDAKIDPATDTAYVADYAGGRVLVVADVSQKSGTCAPDRVLTGLSNPNSLFLDVHNNRLFVSSRDGADSYAVGVVENMSSASGPVSFSRQMSGFGVAAGMTGFYR